MDQEKGNEDLILKELENMTEEELDQLLTEQAKMVETLEKLDENSDAARKIFEDIKNLSSSPDESETQYQERADQIKQAITELNDKIKPLKEKS